MEWFKQNFIEISAIIGFLTAIGPIAAVIQNLLNSLRRSSKTDRIFQYIKNLKELGSPEKRTAKHTREYDRLVFNKIHKTSLSYSNQNKLIKFHKKHREVFDWRSVTSAAAYFDFSNKKVTIKIPFSAWLEYGYFLFNIALLFLMFIGSLLLVTKDYAPLKQMALFGVIVAAWAGIIFLIATFIAPVNMALKIKKYLAKL